MPETRAVAEGSTPTQVPAPVDPELQHMGDACLPEQRQIGPAALTETMGRTTNIR